MWLYAHERRHSGDAECVQYFLASALNCTQAKQIYIIHTVGVYFIVPGIGAKEEL